MIFKRENSSLPTIIAGPCSAENEDQVRSTAMLLSEIGIKFFRAGVWKPRTMPGSFEGLGEAALGWLQAVHNEYNMMVGTEVANSSHVEQSLKYGIDFLWIGARSTANPFVVQEIADSLRGVKIPILIKNPINPELALWIGAIERVLNSGIEEIIAVHRGFSSYNEKLYRNAPLWNIPFELKRILPDIQILSDPSHICGRADLVESLTKQAMDLGFDGAMIESHIDPSNALSDKNQQITPSDLKVILENIVIRERNDSSIHIEKLRCHIDELDKELLETLSKRMSVSREIGKYKEKLQIPILQTDRYSTIIYDRVRHASQLGLNEDFIKTILKIIHEESVTQQLNQPNEIARKKI